MRREVARQGLHITFTSALAGVSIVVSQQVFLILCVSLLMLLVWFVRARAESAFFLHLMERDHDKQRFPGKGAIMVLCGAFLTGLLFPAHILPALLVLGLGDSLSTLVGMRFGKKKLLNTNKSWIGSAAFLLVSCVILVWFSSWWLLIALVATLAEIINYHRFLYLDDNLVIPLVVGLLLTLL